MSEPSKDGGAAFPLCKDAANSPVTDMFGNDISSGMSLRDYFAAAALTGLLASNATYQGSTAARDLLAKDALAHADALLAAREVKHG